MKPPRLPASQSFGQHGASEPISLVEMAINGNWSPSTSGDRPGLVSWRTTLALMLRGVDIEPIAVSIWPVLEAMAQQLVARVEVDLALAPGRLFRMSYFDWLATWLEQFDHWHDPVRSLVASHCVSGDAAKVAAQFPLFSGLAFADFILSAVEAFDERQAWRAAMMDEPQPTPSLPANLRRVGRATAMERVCHRLFEEFQEQAAVAIADAPLEFSLASLVGDIYANGDDQSSQIVIPGLGQ